jgi:predicted RNA-binding protein YlqC (UPF0109 family)
VQVGAERTGRHRTADLRGSLHSVCLAFRLIWKLVQHYEMEQVRDNPYVALSADGSALAMQSAALLVSASAAGALIGPGGSVVQALRESTGADISVKGARDDLPGLVTIRGSGALVEAGFDAVVAKLCERAPPSASGTTPGPVQYADGAIASGPLAGLRIPDDDPAAAASLTALAFAIPSAYAGRVIGRGGSQIKAMRAECGCAVVVESDDSAARREALAAAAVADDAATAAEASIRIVTVTGTPAQIKRALALLEDALAQAMAHAEVGAPP